MTTLGRFVVAAAVLTMSMCATLWAQARPDRDPKVEIRKVNGIPRLFVDGEPIPMLAYRNRIHDDFDYMKQFADSGVRLFFMTHLVDWNKSTDEHFTEVRRRLDAILDFNPRTVVILGMYIGVPPQWAQENQDEVVWLEGRPLLGMVGGARETATYSLASRKFEAEAVAMVNRHLDFLATYPRRSRVIGLFFEGGSAQEWNNFGRGRRYEDLPDTSPAMLRAYREFVRDKYKTDEALAKAYGQPGLTFETLQFPDPTRGVNPDVGDFYDPEKSQALPDYWRTGSKEIADRMLAVGHAAKKRAPYLLAGCFHEPMMDEGKGSYEIERILDSPDLDFFAGPPAYEMRLIADHLPIHHIIDSVLARGKLFFVEEDLRPYGIGQRQFRRDHPEQVIQDTISTYRRDLLNDQAKGVCAWVWDFQSQWFGRQQPYFDAFKQLGQIGMLNITSEVKPVSEIALLVDENSKYYNRGNQRINRNLLHRQFLSELGSIGAPFDVWLHQDVARADFPLDRYKLVIALNCQRLNDADRKVMEKLKGGGRTVLWLHASGFIDDDRSPALSVKYMTELTGFDFARYDQRVATTIVVPNSNNDLTKLFPLGYTFGQFYRLVDNGRVFPPVTRVAPVFVVEDKNAVPAGWYALENIHPPAETTTGEVIPPDSYGDNYYVGFAYRKFPEWTSVYAGVIALPSEFIRDMAKFAGVHLYLDNDDLLYANDHMIVVNPRGSNGPRTVRLRAPSRVWSLLDGLKPVGDGPVTEFTVDGPLFRPQAFWLSDRKPTLP